MNDNNDNKIAEVPEEFTAAAKQITAMGDKDRLGLFLCLIESGVNVTTAFIKDEDTDVFTHQVIRIECGDYATVSRPEPLEMPLRPATGKELHAVVN